MTPQQLTKHFFELESQKDFIDQFDFKKTNSWIHVKFSIYQASLKKSKVSKSEISHLPFILKLLFSNIKNVLFKQKKNTMFFGSSRGLSASEEQENDIYFPYDSVNLSEANIFYNLNKFSEYQINKSYYSDNSIVIENIFSPLISRISKLSIWEFIFLKDFKSSANSLGVSVIQIKGFHIQFILNYYMYSILLFFYSKQKEAFIVSAYSKSFICAALKNKRIPVTEIQHGHIGKYHFGYNYGYLKSSLPLPNKILVDNLFWKEELRNGNFIKNISIRKIVKKVNPLSDDMKQLQPYILFTGQGMYEDEVYTFLNDGILFCELNKLNLIYKPHPNEKIDSKIKKLCLKNNKFLKYYEGSDKIGTLIKYSLNHISISSFCHFEAINMLHRSFVLKIDGENNVFDDFILKRPNEFIVIKKLNDLESVLNFNTV